MESLVALFMESCMAYALFILTYFMDEVFSKSNNEKTHREGSPRSLLVFAPFFSARLVFPLPPLSAPGSPTKHQDFPLLTVFLTIITSSQNISITLLQILLKLHRHRGDRIGEKSSCERFCKVPRAENRTIAR